MVTTAQRMIQTLRKHWRYAVLFVIGLLLALLGLTQINRGELQIGSLSPLPQHSLIKVHTNHDPAWTYTEPYRDLTRPGENLEQIMIDGVQSAQYSIDLAVQEFRLPLLAQALAERQKVGVKVRIILENTYSRSWASYSRSELEQLTPHLRERYRDWLNLVDINADGQVSQAELAQRDAITILNNAGIPWLDDTADGSPGSMLMHHKFIVIDGKKLIATTANFTLSDVHGDIGAPDTRGNANSLLEIDSPQLAALFTEEFKIMWGDGPGGKPDSRFGVQKPLRPTQRVQIGDATVDLKFSPTSRRTAWAETTNGLISQVLKTAQKSVDLALFVFSDQELVNALEMKHRNGVSVRALVDPGFIYRDFSEALDMLGVALANTGQARRGKCYYEAGNRPWSAPIATVGTPELAKGDKLHHKYGLIDDRTVIVGSHNWSEAANRGNDEFLLVVYHPTVAAHYEREFERLYANAQLGLPEWVNTKIARQLEDCGGKILARDASATSTPGPSSNLETDEPATESATPLNAHSTAAARPSPPSTGKINLNTASEAELISLPGVGPKIAQAMIKTRTNKPFRSLADLDAVPGIGPKMLERLKDRVTW